METDQFVFDEKRGSGSHFLFKLYNDSPFGKVLISTTAYATTYADAWPYRKVAKEYVRRIVDSVGSKYATDPNYVDTMYKVIEMVKSEVIKQHL